MLKKIGFYILGLISGLLLLAFWAYGTSIRDLNNPYVGIVLLVISICLFVWVWKKSRAVFWGMSTAVVFGGLFVGILLYSYGRAYAPTPWTDDNTASCQRMVSFRNVSPTQEERFKQSLQTGTVNYGEYGVCELIDKAWLEYSLNHFVSALQYTIKYIELYELKAKQQQESLIDFPLENIESYGGLNGVATAYFIQGEVYRQQGMKEEAAQAYQKVIDEYSFGQSYDYQNGLIVRLSEEARKSLGVMRGYGDSVFWDIGSIIL